MVMLVGIGFIAILTAATAQKFTRSVSSGVLSQMFQPVGGSEIVSPRPDRSESGKLPMLRHC